MPITISFSLLSQCIKLPMTKQAEGQDKEVLCVEKWHCVKYMSEVFTTVHLGLQTPLGLGFKVDSVMKGDVDVKSGSRGLYVVRAINGDLN